MKVRFLALALIFGALASTTGTISAQQKIDPTLEVKRDFDAKLLEITKGKLYSNFADSLGIFDLSFKYSIFDRPIKDLYEFTPLPSAAIDKTPGIKQPFINITAGTNFPLNPYGSLYLQPRLPSALSLVIFGDHNSFMGKLPGVVKSGSEISRGTDIGDAPSSVTNGGLKFRFSWKTGVTGIEATLAHRYNSYYGINENQLINLSQFYPYPAYRNSEFMKDSLSTAITKQGIKVFAKSVNNKNNSILYDIDLSYGTLNSKANFYEIYDSYGLPFPGFLKESKIDEKYLNLGLTAGSGFSGNSKILSGVRFESSNSPGSDSLNRSNLEIHPRYVYSKKRLNFDLGIKYNVWWDKGISGYNLYFSGSASFELVKNKIWIYGVLDGKNNFMNFSKLADLNPWIHPKTEVKNVEQPVIARAGIKGKFRERVSFNIYGGYYEYRNQLYFYANNSIPTSIYIPANSFGAWYANEKRVGFGGEVFVKTEDFSGGINADLYSYRDDNNMTNKHYNYSPFELKAYARYSWRERIIVYTSFHFRQRTPALFQEDLVSSSVVYPSFIPSSALLNAEFSYIHNRKVTMFIRLNNILDSDIIYLATYPMPGFNGGVGIAVKF
ncbi:hypothetical protein MASR2M69_07010 [Bacteroidota bacterium]